MHWPCFQKSFILKQRMLGDTNVVLYAYSLWLCVCTQECVYVWERDEKRIPAGVFTTACLTNPRLYILYNHQIVPIDYRDNGKCFSAPQPLYHSIYNPCPSLQHFIGHSRIGGYLPSLFWFSATHSSIIILLLLKKNVSKLRQKWRWGNPVNAQTCHSNHSNRFADLDKCKLSLRSRK